MHHTARAIRGPTPHRQSEAYPHTYLKGNQVCNMNDVCPGQIISSTRGSPPTRH